MQWLMHQRFKLTQLNKLFINLKRYQTIMAGGCGKGRGSKNQIKVEAMGIFGIRK